MCSIIGVGGRLHKVLGQIDLGTLDSGERSLPLGYLLLNVLKKCSKPGTIFSVLSSRFKVCPTPLF